MKKITVLVILISTFGFAAALDTLKSNLAALEKQIADNDRKVAGLIMSKISVSKQMAAGCDIDLGKYNQGLVTQAQRSCVNSKFADQQSQVKAIDEMIGKDQQTLKGYFSDYDKILSQAKKELSPVEIKDLMGTATLLNRAEIKNSASGLRMQMLRAELNKKQQEFEESMDYSFTAAAIQNTLNSPLLCSAAARCPSEERGTLTASEIKKSILNSAVDSAVKKAGKQPASPVK